eukprot:1160493-Pelagomonas_calceolata.AAC.3
MTCPTSCGTAQAVRHLGICRTAYLHPARSWATCTCSRPACNCRHILLLVIMANVSYKQAYCHILLLAIMAHVSYKQTYCLILLLAIMAHVFCEQPSSIHLVQAEQCTQAPATKHLLHAPRQMSSVRDGPHLARTCFHIHLLTSMACILHAA